MNGKGKHIILGPYPSHLQAQMNADKLDRDYNIMEFKTRSLPEATRLIKHKMFAESGDIDSSTKRVSHAI